MGRRSGLGGLVTAIARAQRASVAAHKRAVREQARAERQHARAVRQYERALAAHNREMEREAKRQYVEDQLESAEDQTAALAAMVDALDAVLSHTIDVDDRIDFDSLRLPVTYPAFEPPPHLAHAAPEPRRDSYLFYVKAPGFLSQLLPGAQRRYQEQLQLAQARYESAVSEHALAERARVAALNAAHDDYERRKAEALAEARQRNSEVDDFEAAYLRGEPDSVVVYNTMVLERSDYPADMPHEFRLEYDPGSREVVIDYELPDATIIPATAEVRYVKSKDAFEEKPRKASEIRARHQKLVASIAVRTIHEVFEADRGNHVDFVTFSGFVHTVEPATGQDSRTYLVGIRAARAEFECIDVGRADPTACVRKFSIATRSQATPPASRRIDRGTSV